MKHLVVSGSQAFWSTTPGIMVAPLTTGVARDLAPWPADLFAVSTSHVYWHEFSERGTIRRAPVAGGEPSLVARTVFLVTAMAADATGVYWTNERGLFKLIPKP